MVHLTTIKSESQNVERWEILSVHQQTEKANQTAPDIKDIIRSMASI